MTGETIKSFLVGLGFGVDETTLAAFNKAIAGASLKVAALYAGVKVAAAGIFLGISKISEGFEQIGYEYRIIAPAINKALQLRNAMLLAYKTAGINITKAVQQSVIFNFSLAKTKFALEAIYKSVGLKFIPLLTKQMDGFRKQIYANLPKIQAILEKFINFVFKAFEATSILGGRLFTVLEKVYDFFKMLDKATSGWSTIILGAVAAWKLLNLSFLATPLGLLITGLTALLALWDDLQTFKEGGESLFNWGPVIPYIDAIVVAMTPLVELVTNLFASLWKLIHLDFSGAFGSLQAALQNVITLFQNLWEAVKSLGSNLGSVLSTVASNVTDSLGKSIKGTLGNLGAGALNFVSNTPNLPANVATANNPAVASLANPVGSNVQNSQTTQHVSQETSIIVQGSADANSTGKAIAGEQNKVNFDMARNMRGAVR